MNHSNGSLPRQIHLDWIRVLATLFVFLFHCAMFFNPFPWHVKNNELDSTWILALSLMVGTWLMPIFFAISGISVFYALQKRSQKAFLKERMIRIGVPLLVGIFLLAPPQVYVERLTHGQFEGPFLSFLPSYFDGWYLEIGGSGNFAFVGLHLWYLFVLLIFSLFMLPLFLKVKRSIKSGFLSLFLLPMPLIMVAAFIKTIGLGGWDLIFYLVVFLYGFYYFREDSLYPVLKKAIPVILPTAILTTLVYVYWIMRLGMPTEGLGKQLLFSGIHAGSCWAWILLIFHWSKQHLSFSNGLLSYGGEASMPFYVMHQPVIILVAYFLRDLPWSIPVKLCFLVLVSFFIIMALYHFAIRKIDLLRVGFGMKRKKKKSLTANTASM
ncbi:peptidoglycan/LPS O-acetylase OafA/YrhL [Bacillus tianshenii]|uniref:Peptidoglycan/LPS O-acetylase OafA/YrhL n=1 Tax=Sutcliffiella tianshenii TaxID=1463404 RepID=A0ABS2P0F7_9BACI|nr:acyltransferase family protein [Bacillus tianshenii]MBM7619910.1 peptidoglycan/LPS O-acetylase OafA/YrhL [Bacillus tianshenii]